MQLIEQDKYVIFKILFLAFIKIIIRLGPRKCRQVLRERSTTGTFLFAFAWNHLLRFKVKQHIS